MSGEKILVIDDRRENLLFLANSVLRPEGYEVITAMDGKQGLDKALAERPNLIITDLKMPRMSGLELMASLRKAERTSPSSSRPSMVPNRLPSRPFVWAPRTISSSPTKSRRCSSRWSEP